MSFLSEAAEIFRRNSAEPAAWADLAGSTAAAAVIIVATGSPLIAIASFVAGGLVQIVVKVALTVRWRDRRPY
jgi:hypothetical protein